MGIIITFLDLSASFNTLNHSIMINRLANASFTCKAMDWLTSYISSRNSCVSINDKRSLDIHLEHGVPQSSLLLPNISYHSYADIQIYIRACIPNDTFK